MSVHNFMSNLTAASTQTLKLLCRPRASSQKTGFVWTPPPRKRVDKKRQAMNQPPSAPISQVPRRAHVSPQAERMADSEGAIAPQQVRTSTPSSSKDEHPGNAAQQGSKSAQEAPGLRTEQCSPTEPHTPSESTPSGPVAERTRSRSAGMVKAHECLMEVM